MNKGREQYKNHQRHSSSYTRIFPWELGMILREDDPNACHLNKTGKITQLSEVILIISNAHYLVNSNPRWKYALTMYQYYNQWCICNILYLSDNVISWNVCFEEWYCINLTRIEIDLFGDNSIETDINLNIWNKYL